MEIRFSADRDKLLTFANILGENRTRRKVAGIFVEYRTPDDMIAKLRSKLAKNLVILRHGDFSL